VLGELLGWGKAHLHISQDVVLESLGGNSQVRMYSAPVVMEGLVCDIIALLKIDRDFNCRLEVGLRCEAELGMLELVVGLGRDGHCDLGCMRIARRLVTPRGIIMGIYRRERLE
jgi:hypothetical protein